MNTSTLRAPVRTLPFLSALLSPVFFAPPEARGQTPGTSGTVITIAGTGLIGYSGDGGPAVNAMLHDTQGAAVGRDGTIYINDTGNHRIRALDVRTGIIRTLAGNGETPTVNNGNYTGPAASVALNHVPAVAVDRSRHVLYFSDINYNWVRRISLADEMMRPYAGTGQLGVTGDGGLALQARVRRPAGLGLSDSGTLYVVNQSAFRMRKVDPVSTIISHVTGTGSSALTGDGGPAESASIANPFTVTVDPAGHVFFRDGDPNGQYFTVRRIDAVTGIVTTVAGGGEDPPGTGPGTSMKFVDMYDVAAGAAGEVFFTTNFRVWRLDTVTGQVSPAAGTGAQGFSGDGGPALAAEFDGITGLATVPGGGLVVLDGGNFRVRYVAPDSIQLTGDSALTEFYLPWVRSLAGEVNIAGNQGAAVIDLNQLESTGGPISIGNNSTAAVIDLSGLETVAGSVSITDNPSAAVIGMAEIDSVAGSVTIEGNTGAAEVNLPELQTAGSPISIGDNTSAAVIDLGALVTAGTVTISGNTSAEVVDMNSLGTATGNVTIENNAPDTEVDLRSLTQYGCGAIPVTLQFNGGTILIPAGMNLCANAILTGSTTLQGGIINRGRIKPGSSPGRLNITGSLTLMAESRLEMELGGLSPGHYDVIATGGDLTLGGTLEMKLLTPFPGTVPAGTSLTMLPADGALTGVFTNAASGATVTTSDGYARGTVRYAGENAVRLTDIVILDTDGDAMPDWWEDTHGLDKTSAADAVLDTDRDGASHLQEWLADTAPQQAQSVLQIVSAARGPGSVTVSVATSALREYTLERNTSLTTEFTPVETKPGTGGEVVLTDPTPPDARGLYRVRAGVPGL